MPELRVNNHKNKIIEHQRSDVQSNKGVVGIPNGETIKKQAEQQGRGRKAMSIAVRDGS